MLIHLVHVMLYTCYQSMLYALNMYNFCLQSGFLKNFIVNSFNKLTVHILQILCPWETEVCIPQWVWWRWTEHLPRTCSTDGPVAPTPPRGSEAWREPVLARASPWKAMARGLPGPSVLTAGPSAGSVAFEVSNPSAPAFPVSAVLCISTSCVIFLGFPLSDDGFLKDEFNTNLSFLVIARKLIYIC